MMLYIHAEETDTFTMKEIGWI